MPESIPTYHKPRIRRDLRHDETHLSAAHFSGAHHFVSNGGTYNNIFGNYNYMVMEEPGLQALESRKLKGIIDGSRVISIEDVCPERQIYKGCGYRLHAAQTSGKIVAMKVYEGTRARERCSEAARFHQKAIHPNLPHMIGVSPLGLEHPFLIFDGEYEGVVNEVLGQVLSKDLRQILTLGLQTVIGLSSGLDYLQDLKYPLQSVGLGHFVILSRKGKTVISFDPDGLDQTNQSDQELGRSNGPDAAMALFHELCQQTFDSACKAHYQSQHIERHYLDELDPNADLPQIRFEELDSSSSSPTPSTQTSQRPSSGKPPKKLFPDGCRRELVWKSLPAETVSLADISNQFQDFLNAYRSTSGPTLNRRRGRHMARTAHRCPGYNRAEITLTPSIMHSAIIEHSTPIPHEICPVCKEVVTDVETFNCICGGDDDGHTSTVRCTSCCEWHHWPCVDFSAFDRLTFVCQRCQERDVRKYLESFKVHGNQELQMHGPQQSTLNHGFFSDSSSTIKTVLAVPMEVYESGNKEPVIRAVPIAVLNQ